MLSQLINHRINSLSDQETIGKLAEMDMIVAELERSNNRAAAAERRNVSSKPCTYE